MDKLRKLAEQISIHAPAKGATKGYSGITYIYLISIHAPAKGATSANAAYLAVEHISIHAPAKGATIARNILILLPIFQSTLPRRERLLG